MIIIRTLALLLLAMLSGCYRTTSGRDAWPSQPYYGGSDVAIAEARITSYLLFDMRGSVTWTKPGFDRVCVSASRVVKKTIRFLKPFGYSFEEVPRDDENRKELLDDAAQNPLSIERAHHIFQSTVVVCCIDPIVVVIAPIPIGTFYWGKALNGFPAHFYAPDLVAEDEPELNKLIVVGLPGGIVYGQQVPYSSDLLWASPDLNIEPTPIQFGPNSEGRILVPWGMLRLVPSGDLFQVIAEQSD